MTYKTPDQLNHELQGLRDEVVRLAQLIQKAVHRHSPIHELSELDMSMARAVEAVREKGLEIKKNKQEEEFIEGIQRERILEELQRRDGL